MAFWNQPLLRFRWLKREFALSSFPVVLLAAAWPVFIHLGLWQIDRAAERQQAQAEFEAMLGQPPLLLADTQFDEDSDALVRVEVQGKIDASRQFLLDAQEHNTIMGYEVLVPLLFSSGQAVLVSRGWVPEIPGQTPDLALPENLSTEAVTVVGLAVKPPPRVSPQYRKVLEAEKARNEKNGIEAESWPMIIQEENFPELSALLKTTLIPRVLQPESIEFGYTRHWKPVTRSPAINYGYAAQFFGMGVALTALVLFVCSRRYSGQNNQAKVD